jgi:M6 family metalloprotease-like protein/uncharacterized repeat protein (TIGR01451 family)
MSKFFSKQFWVVLAAAFACLTGLQAAPFNKTISYKQPDGTVIQLHGWGDEFQAIFETLDGYTVVFDQTAKAYCYAQVDSTGQLISSGVQVQQESPASLGLVKHQRVSDALRKQQAVARWQKWENGMQIEAQWAARKTALAAIIATNGSIANSPPTATTTGVKVGLTLLIDFSDDPATVPQADIIDFLNGDFYNGYGNNGSVKSYYQDVSAGLLTYTNVVTVYVRVPQPKTYYNDITKDNGTQGNLLIKDALDTLKALPNYNTDILPLFANLTVDANNQVMAFNVFYAGDNGGVWSMGLWPHSWVLANVGAQTLGNGMSVFKYQVSNIGAALTLGTFCHENGHMLCGYPDLYDYGYDSIGGAGDFCLMGSGAFDSNPVEICAYLKRASGWATTVDLDATSSLTAISGVTGTNFNRIYRYANTNAATEYYLIENRQRIGRDSLVPGSGLAIWHVDELGDRDNQSLVYNTTHANYELTLMQADNLWHFENNVNSGDANDLYYTNNSAVGYLNLFSDTNQPSSRWWNGTNSGFRVSGISASGSVMTFNVGTTNGGGTITVVTNISIAAPQKPWGSTLSVMNGDNPNGAWYLFMQDVNPSGSGVLSNGWFLTLTMSSPVEKMADNQLTANSLLQTNVVASHWNLTLAVTNYGPSTSSNVYVTDILPAGLVLVSTNVSYGSVTSSVSGVLTWNVGTLALGEGASVNLNLYASAVGAYNNTATVSADTTDLNPDDDTVVSSLVVSGALVPPTVVPAVTAGGSFSLSINGSPGVTTVVQASTDLKTWVPVYTNIGSFTFTSSDITSYSQRFYRAISTP